jgi:hypothetical protein
MTNVTGNTIFTSTTVQARLLGTIIYINFTIFPFKSIYTNAGIATIGVGTGGSILAYIWSNGTLVNVLGTVLTRVFWATLARIRIDTVNTFSTILT